MADRRRPVSSNQPSTTASPDPYRSVGPAFSQRYNEATNTYYGPPVLTSSLRFATPALSSPSLPPSSPFTPAAGARFPLSRPTSGGGVNEIQPGRWGSIGSESPASPDRTGQLGPGNRAFDPQNPMYDHTNDMTGFVGNQRSQQSPTLPSRGQIVQHPGRQGISQGRSSTNASQVSRNPAGAPPSLLPALPVGSDRRYPTQPISRFGTAQSGPAPTGALPSLPGQGRGQYTLADRTLPLPAGYSGFSNVPAHTASTSGPAPSGPPSILQASQRGSLIRGDEPDTLTEQRRGENDYMSRLDTPQNRARSTIQDRFAWVQYYRLTGVETFPSASAVAPASQAAAVSVEEEASDDDEGEESDDDEEEESDDDE